MEISRWSSEPGERTPPDQRHPSHAPRRVRRESFGSFRHPIRGAFVLRCDPVVFARASLDHRLISVVPPGQRRLPPFTAFQNARQAPGLPASPDPPLRDDAFIRLDSRPRRFRHAQVPVPHPP